MAKAVDRGLPAGNQLLIEDVDAYVTVTLQGPGGGAHEDQGMGGHDGVLKGDGADTEAITQHHDDRSTDYEEQGEPGTKLAETLVERIDKASHAQQGRGIQGHCESFLWVPGLAEVGILAVLALCSNRHTTFSEM